MSTLGVLAYWIIPVLRYSAISATGALVGVVTGSALIGTIFTLVFVYVMLFLMMKSLTAKKGALKKAALREELMFRAGAEDWSWRQRLTSNSIFGAVHLLNLYVPLAAVLTLAMGGWWFMSVYRSSYKKTRSRVTAVQESAAVHAAHNTLVFWAMLPGYVLYVLITSSR